MVQINFHSREVNCKIVFYGPGRSGKTTNLEVVHRKAPKDSVGEMVSIATEQDRTLYFDFLPLNLGMVAGMTTKFQLYTVPGQVYYNETRKLVLQGTDGVVFVADSHPDMEQENVASLNNLVENLRENGIDIADLPLVLQYNKRDLPNAMSIEKLDATLNKWGAPTVPAVAISDEKCVFKTLKLVSSLVIKKLNRQNGTPDTDPPASESTTGTAAVSAPPAAPPAPPPVPAVASAPKPVVAPPPAPPRPAAPPPVAPSAASGAVPRPVMSIPQVPKPSGALPAVSRQSGPVAVPPPRPAAPPPAPPPRPAAPPPVPSAPPAAAVQAPMAPPQNAPSAQIAQAMAQAQPSPMAPARSAAPVSQQNMAKAIAAGGKPKGNGMIWGIIIVVIVILAGVAVYVLTSS